jgi:thiamine biosynthesis protein ThiI
VKGVLLLSGGIDSPVAGYLMGRQGVDLVAIHFNPSHAGEPGETEKVTKIMERMEAALGTAMEKVVVEHGDTLDLLSGKCRRNLTCVLCRRMMLRVASRMAESRGASFIITGESLGQVASQTMMNIFVEEEASSVPVLRPLIGMDKVEIERFAKKIGTYEISVSTGSCCTHAPDKPSTGASMDSVLEAEASVDVADMTENCIRSARKVG